MHGISLDSISVHVILYYNILARPDVLLILKSILRISASNVLKTFLNIIVSIGCKLVIFHTYNSTESSSID